MITGVSGLSDPLISAPVPSRAGESEPVRYLTEGHPMIDALVTLLSHESKTSNLVIIRSRLIELGATALPYLERAADGAPAGGEDTVRGVALEIRRRLLDAEWDGWVHRSDGDLETGALLIDRFGDPAREPLEVSRTLDTLALALDRRLAHVSDTEQTLATITSFLFEDVGFRGNTEAYEDPENSYLSRVLASKLGIPVSLSVVMLLIAERLRLPIVGIGMPGHFLVRYGSRVAGPYLDPFGGGKVLTRGECAEWLRSSGFEFHPRMLQPVNARQIVARMLRNLLASFSKQGAVSETAILSGYLKRVQTSCEAVETSAGPDASAEAASG